MRQREPAHPIANKLARSLPSDAPAIGARSKGLRVAQLAVLRAAQRTEQAKARKAAAMALTEAERSILQAICESGQLVVPSSEVKPICDQLLARKLLRPRVLMSQAEGTMKVAYETTAAGRAALR